MSGDVITLDGLETGKLAGLAGIGLLMSAGTRGRTK